MNANETSIARGQNSLARSLDHSILVNAALMALTHGVYTIFLVNAAKHRRRAGGQLRFFGQKEKFGQNQFLKKFPCLFVFFEEIDIFSILT